MSLESLLLLQSLTHFHSALSNNWGPGRIHYTKTITEFLRCLPLPGVFGLVNGFLAHAHVAQNIFSSVTWCLYLLSVLCDMQNWTICPTTNLSQTHTEELLPLQALGQPYKTGLFLWDRVYGILFWGFMLPADRLFLQTQKLTQGSFFPVISFHQKWVIESERSKVKSVQGSNEVHSLSVCTCASSCKELQLNAMNFKEMAHRNGAAHSNLTMMELRIDHGEWLTWAWTLANNSCLI